MWGSPEGWGSQGAGAGAHASPAAGSAPTFPQAQGSCQSELHRALERLAASQTRTHEDLYVIPIPNCDRNGNFHPKQVGRALTHHGGLGAGGEGELFAWGHFAELGAGTDGWTGGPVLGHSRAPAGPGFGGNRLLGVVGPFARAPGWDEGGKAPARAPSRPSWVACRDGAVGARLGASHQTRPLSVTRRWTGSGASAGAWTARPG